MVKGTIFEGGEKMTVWVSDDPNHIPLRIESPIIVGSLKVDMKQYKNLRYPLSSQIIWYLLHIFKIDAKFVIRSKCLLRKGRMVR